MTITDVEPLLRITWTDPVTQRHGYAVIDSLVDGLAFGGTRARAGMTLVEAERLARIMTQKCAVMGVRAGGGKGGIDCDPQDPEMPAMMSRFVEAIRPIVTMYWVTGEDMGVAQGELDEIYAGLGLTRSVGAVIRSKNDPAMESRLEAAFAAKVEGIELIDSIGGYGVAEAVFAALDHLGRPASETTAVVQGFGSMGGSAARYLARRGVRVVGVIDSLGCIYNPNSLDVERLLAARNHRGEISRSALADGDAEFPRDQWLSLPCDVLIPAAVPDAIHADNCSDVTASVIVEAANICTTAEAQASLHNRGVLVIPDFVANSGTNSWFWWVLTGEIGTSPDDAFAKVSAAMRDAVAELLNTAEAQGILPRAGAETVAAARLAELTVVSDAHGHR